MNIDYYQILGVSETADRETIAKAYRRMARQNHPDRGGAHEKMIRINEAGEILCDPEKRQRYDEARRNPTETALQQATETDTRQARSNAQNYPLRWADFEKWLGSRYHAIDDWTFNKVQHARSKPMGWVSMIIGGLLAGIFISPSIAKVLLLEKNRAGSYFHPENLFRINCIIIPVLAGMYLGAFVFGMLDQNSKKAAEPHESSSGGTPPSTVSGGASASRTLPAPIIVACQCCGQKLRVPKVAATLFVTCTFCGSKFYLPPTSG